MRNKGRGMFMNRVEQALKINRSGYNCAQSVLLAYSDVIGLDEKAALAMAAGFGGGVRYGEVCGAISGAVMVLGLLYPFSDSADMDAKYKIARISKSVCERFREKRGVVTCRELLEVTAGEEKPYRLCADYVVDCVQIVEDIIAEEQQSK